MRDERQGKNHRPAGRPSDSKANSSNADEQGMRAPADAMWKGVRGRLSVGVEATGMLGAIVSTEKKSFCGNGPRSAHACQARLPRRREKTSRKGDKPRRIPGGAYR